MEARLCNLDSLLQHATLYSSIAVSPVGEADGACEAIGSPATVADGHASANHWLGDSSEDGKGLLMNSREVSLRVLAHANRELLVYTSSPAHW
jgi:hypothetical protein